MRKESSSRRNQKKVQTIFDISIENGKLKKSFGVTSIQEMLSFCFQDKIINIKVLADVSKCDIDFRLQPIISYIKDEKKWLFYKFIRDIKVYLNESFSSNEQQLRKQVNECCILSLKENTTKKHIHHAIWLMFKEAEHNGRDMFNDHLSKEKFFDLLSKRINGLGSPAAIKQGVNVVARLSK